MADRILLNATKGKPKSLSICNKELRNVPPIIGKITSLKSVDLKNNVLTDLPSEFSSLKQVITSRQSVYSFHGQKMTPGWSLFVVLMNFSLLWELSLTLNFLLMFCFTSLNL